MPPGGRRLTLAPAVRARLQQPRSDKAKIDAAGTTITTGDHAQAMRAIREIAERAAEASGKPKLKHGVEPIASKFWATGDSDSESSVDEEIVIEEEAKVEEGEITTQQFIAEAQAVGFSIADLQQAEKDLSSPTAVSTSPRHKHSLAKRIVSAMVESKLKGRPWQGPLPPPRVSPPRTFGDALGSAMASKKVNSYRRSMASMGLSPARSGDARRSGEVGGVGHNSNEQLMPAELEARSQENSIANSSSKSPAGRTMDLDSSVPIQNLNGSEQARSRANQVLIGPGLWFRPTPGLVALFSRTGTGKRQSSQIREKQNPIASRAPPATSRTPRRSYAEVVHSSRATGTAGVAARVQENKGHTPAAVVRGGATQFSAARGEGHRVFDPRYGGGKGSYRGRGQSQQGHHRSLRGRGCRGRGGYESYSGDFKHGNGGWNVGCGYGECAGRSSGRGGRAQGRENQLRGRNAGRGGSVHRPDQQAGGQAAHNTAHYSTLDAAAPSTGVEPIPDDGQDQVCIIGNEWHLVQGAATDGGASANITGVPVAEKENAHTGNGMRMEKESSIQEAVKGRASHSIAQAKADKPGLWGYAVDGSLYYIPYTDKQEVKPEANIVVVKMIEGSMTAAQIVVELERLLPGSSKLQFKVERADNAENADPTMDPEVGGNRDGDNDEQKKERNKEQLGERQSLMTDQDINGNTLTPNMRNTAQSIDKQKPVVIIRQDLDGTNNGIPKPLSTMVDGEGAAATACVSPKHVNANVYVTPAHSSKRSPIADDQGIIEKAGKLNAGVNLEEPHLKDFFAGTIQGYILAPVLDQVAAKQRRQRAAHHGMSYTGDGGSTFFHFTWMVL